MQTFSHKGKFTFTPPKLEQIIEIFLAEGATVLDAEIFYYHYEATGWKIGTSQCRSWRALAVSWVKREANQVIKNQDPAPTAPTDFFRQYNPQEEEELLQVRQGYARLKALAEEERRLKDEEAQGGGGLE